MVAAPQKMNAKYIRGETEQRRDSKSKPPKRKPRFNLETVSNCNVTKDICSATGIVVAERHSLFGIDDY